MKKVLVGAVAVLVLLVATALGYGAYRLRSLNTPEFRQGLLDRASLALGTRVQAREMDISVMRGVTLRGIEVANPRGFEGRLLTADGFVLRHRLLPLLRGRLEIERLALQKPNLALAMDAKGAFNYEKLGGARPESPAAKGTASPASLPLRLVLDELAVEDATATVTDAAKATLLKLEGGTVRSRLEAGGGAFAGSGDARIAVLDLMDTLFVRKVKAPIRLSKRSVELAPIQGTLAGGELSGEVKLDLAGGFRYALSLDVSRASVATLLEEAGLRKAASGTLRARASFEGTGGAATMKGRGRADIADCRLSDSKVLGGLALALRVPELADPDFEECTIDFTMARGRVETPSLALKGAQVQLTGRGQMTMETGALDYDLTLALAPPVFAKVTAREIRSAFRDRGDGFMAIDFRVTGTTAAPKNDLIARLGQAAATEAVKGSLGKLFGKKKPF